MDRLALLPPDGAAPASAYLARLKPRSCKAMRRALETIAVLITRVPMLKGKPLGRVALDRVPWASLTAEHITWARAQLAQRYAPASVRQCMCGLRGVLAELKVLDAARVAATLVHVPKASRPPWTPPVLADDARPTQVRDAALYALVRGVGLTLPKALGLDVGAWRVGGSRLVVRGRLVRVPDALGDALDRWVSVRGVAPGPLVCRMVKGGRVLSALPLSIGAARKAVAKGVPSATRSAAA